MGHALQVLLLLLLLEANLAGVLGLVYLARRVVFHTGRREVITVNSIQDILDGP